MNSTIKITKSFVDSVIAPGFYWDKELKGFGFRISGKTKSYIVQSRVNGTAKSRRVTIGRHGVFTAEEARKRAREILVQMANGVDPKEEVRAKREEGTTLQELFNEYLKNKRLAPRTRADYEGYMARYFFDWLNKPITSIKPDTVQERHAFLGKNHGEAQADVAMRCLRALYNFAAGIYTRKDGDPLITVIPTKRLSATKQWFRPKRRDSYIPEERFAAWYNATVHLASSAPGHNTDTIRDYLLLIVFTGLRRTEASLIRWEHVIFDERRLLLPKENTKNGENFSIPLTTFTFDLLKRRYAVRRSDWVFPGGGKTGHLVEPKYAMQKIAEASGVKFTLHDLRRTFATYADSQIDNEWTIKRLMNHLTGQDVTQRYKQGIQRLREPAQRVTDYMLESIEQGNRASGTQT